MKKLTDEEIQSELEELRKYREFAASIIAELEKENERLQRQVHEITKRVIDMERR